MVVTRKEGSIVIWNSSAKETDERKVAVEVGRGGKWAPRREKERSMLEVDATKGNDEWTAAGFPFPSRAALCW